MAPSSAGRRSRHAISGPLKLPTNQEELDVALAGILPSAKSENAKTYMADGTPVIASETWGQNDLVRVDLPDVDTSTTRYFWTVVPVGIIVDEDGTFTYYDAESPQDACESGSRGQLRQGVAARDHRRGNAVRLGPLAEGPPARAGRPATGRLLDAARRMATGHRRDRLRGRSGRARSIPWRARGSVLTVRDLVRAPARLRRLVLPRPRTERSAGRHAGDDVVGAVAVKVVRPTFQIRG